MATAQPSTVAALLAAQAAKGKAPAKPAKPEPEALVWESISPDELPADLRDLFYAIGKARSAFETAMTTMLEPPAHLKLAFAYKRGLAIALAPKAKPNAGLQGLMARITDAE